MTITVKNVEYPAIFSLRAAINTSEKYGSVQTIFENGKESENLQRRIWLLHELLVAGKVYAEKEEGLNTPEVPSYDDLLDIIDFADLSDLTLQLLAVVTRDQSASLEVKSSKNAGPTLDR